jgi:hypothetical protein
VLGEQLAQLGQVAGDDRVCRPGLLSARCAVYLGLRPGRTSVANLNPG